MALLGQNRRPIRAQQTRPFFPMTITEHNCHFRLDSIHFMRSLEVMTFQGTEAINKPFSFEVQAVSFYGELDLQKCLFGEAYLSSKLPGIGFHAQIQSIGRSNTGPGPAHYRITLGPRVGCLAHRYNQRVFQDMPAKAIIRKVLREHGIHEHSYCFELNRGYEEIEFCAQHGETDLQLLDRLCAREGFYYYFQHSSNQHLMVFSDDLRHTRPITSVHFESQFVRGEISQFEKSRLGSTGSKALGAMQVKGASALYFLRAGTQLPMTGHPDHSCNQAWLLTEVHHSGLQPQFQMGVVAPVYLNTFTGVQAAFGLPKNKAKSASRRIGLQRARVAGALFDEALRDHEGRIKVRFDWGNHGDGARYTDCWLPLEAPLESAHVQWWGGMEVVVRFVDGDRDQPQIIDYLYDPDISPRNPATVSRGPMSIPPTPRPCVTTRLDPEQFLGTTQQIQLDDLTLHLDSSNQLNFSVGNSHVNISSDGVTLISPNIVMNAHTPAEDDGANGEEDGKNR
jgi:type VI secretion system secreted protein VgrG